MYETRIVGKTKQGIPIFRIDFEDGNWWELHGERTWGTAQAIKIATLGYDTSIDSQALLQRHATNVAALEGSTVRWSWGEEPTAESIKGTNEYPVLVASRELATRHLSLLLGDDDQKKTVSKSSWRWLQVVKSLITGSMFRRTKAR